MKKLLKYLELKLSVYLKSKKLILFVLISPILFAFFVGMLFTDYSGITKLSIGVIDLDESEISNTIFNNLKQSELLNTKKIKPQDLNKSLKNNSCEAVFTLKPGFEENIKSGDFKNSIEITYLDKNLIAPAISDIFAKELLPFVARYSSYNKVDSIVKNENIALKALEFSTELLNSNSFSMKIDYNLKSTNDSSSFKYDTNEILKYRFVFGFSIMFLTMFIMFYGGNIIDDFNSNTALRLKSIGFNVYIGEIVVLFFLAEIIMLIQVLFFIVYLDLFNLFKLIYLILLESIYIGGFSALTVVLASSFKSKASYQNICAPLTLGMGLIGGAFWSIELLPDAMKVISLFSPIYWLLEAISNIIIFNNNFLDILPMVLPFVIIIIFSLSIVKFKSDKIY